MAVSLRAAERERRWVTPVVTVMETSPSQMHRVKARRHGPGGWSRFLGRDPYSPWLRPGGHRGLVGRHGHALFYRYDDDLFYRRGRDLFGRHGHALFYHHAGDPFYRHGRDLFGHHGRYPWGRSYGRGGWGLLRDW